MRGLLYAEVVCSGLLAGLLAGTFGVGGGSVIIPILVLVLGLPVKRAVATSLSIVFLTSLTSLYFHLQQGTANHRGVLMGISGALGAVLGNFVFFSVNNLYMEKVLGVAFLTIGLLTLYKGDGQNEADVKALLITGLIMGIYSGLVGKGGGSLSIPILLNLFGVEMKEAIGVTVTATPIVSLSSLIPKAFAELVEPKVAILFLPGMIIGTFTGSRIMRKVSSNILRLLYSAFMIFVALKFLGFW